MFGNPEERAQRKARAKENRKQMAGDRAAQGAAMVRSEKANQGQLISDVQQLIVEQRRTNDLLAQVLAALRPQQPAPPGNAYQPARHYGSGVPGQERYTQQ